MDGNGAPYVKGAKPGSERQRPHFVGSVESGDRGLDMEAHWGDEKQHWEVNTIKEHRMRV